MVKERREGEGGEWINENKEEEGKEGDREYGAEERRK